MAPKRAASKATQKAQNQTPRSQNAQPQSQLSSGGTPRERYHLTDNVSLEDCIRSNQEREAAEAAEQLSDHDIPQAGFSRAAEKGKSLMTPVEREARAKADYNKGLNIRIGRFGQNSIEVSAYRWSHRHRQPETDYDSSVDSERGQNNTDADAEYAALLQAEETETSQQHAEQVQADRQAAERLQSQLQNPVSQQNRPYAQALERGPQTRAAARQAAAAQSSSARTQDTQTERVQVQQDNEALRIKISELQANLDHEKSKKRTVKQAGIPHAPQSRKMPSSQAGPSRIDRDQHLGNRTARSLASWITNNPAADWEEFKSAFLERNPGQNRQSNQGQQPQPARSNTDNAATAAYCLDRRLCNTCKRLGHNSANCRFEFRPFRYPKEWDEAYWQERARLSAPHRAPSPAQMPRPKFNKFNRQPKK